MGRLDSSICHWYLLPQRQYTPNGAWTLLVFVPSTPYPLPRFSISLSYKSCLFFNTLLLSFPGMPQGLVSWQAIVTIFWISDILHADDVSAAELNIFSTTQFWCIFCIIHYSTWNSMSRFHRSNMILRSLVSTVRVFMVLPVSSVTFYVTNIALHWWFCPLCTSVDISNSM